MQQTLLRLAALESFCNTCPPAQDVSALLAREGFFLVLALGSKAFEQQSGHPIPPLPAQYHYRDSYNTEVIYLAGRDIPEEGQRFPQHASRWWIYPGASQFAYNGIMQTLTVHWSLDWHPTQE